MKTDTAREAEPGVDYLTSVPDTVMLDYVLPFLEATAVGHLMVTCSSMLRLCRHPENRVWWRRMLRDRGLFIDKRSCPEYEEHPGLAFLRLTLRDRKNRRCCFSCLQATSSVHSFYGIPVCFECQRAKGEYRCVTRKTAMGEYCLKGKEVDKLSYICVDNPYYRSAAPMKLYLLRDVVDMAGSRDTEGIKAKKEAVAEKRQTTRCERQRERGDKLKKALATLGLERRHDSELCDKYVEGSLKQWSLDAVVEEMAFMKYLHEYTDYPSRVEELVDELAEDYGHHYKGIWREASDYVKRRYQRPASWPWLQKRGSLTEHTP